MTTTSLVPAVTDYLVAKATAALAPAVTVFDGPQPPTATQSLPQALWIGADPSTPSDAGAEATQTWPFLDHARTRDEDGVIICAAQDWSGDTTVKTHRDGAAAIAAAVELLLRGDPLTGGPGDASMGGLVMWAGVAGPYQWYPRQIAGGTAVLVVFRVTYHARLVTS